MSDMKAIHEAKQHYIAVWKGMLSEFLGWSDGQTMVWAHRFLNNFDDPENMIYHEGPQFYVTDLLIPERLKLRLSKLEQIELRKEIAYVLGGDQFGFVFPDEVDWNHYKKKVNDVLAKFDEHLP